MNKKAVVLVVSAVAVIWFVHWATTPSAFPKPTPQEQASLDLTQKTSNPSTISKSEFEQTHDGMTPEQVDVIVGGPGEMVAELGTPGTRGYNVTYKYTGEGSVGANASILFQNGKLYMKAQYGLK